MRRFLGYRPKPPADYLEKGTANPPDQVQYEGVVFTDGTVGVRWLTDYSSHSVWRCWDDFDRVHGHPEYGTRIVWLDEEDDAHTIEEVMAASGILSWVRLTCRCGWWATLPNDQVDSVIRLHAADPDSTAAELATDTQEKWSPGTTRRRLTAMAVAIDVEVSSRNAGTPNLSAVRDESPALGFLDKLTDEELADRCEHCGLPQALHLHRYERS